MKIKTPRWTTERFKLAARAGCFHDMKVELVGGRLVEMTESPEHRNTVENTEESLIARIGKAHWYVARESSVEFPDWTPLPDISVCRGPRKPTYLHCAPKPEDSILLVEVSQATYRYDRRVKLPRYAKAGIPLLWIVNLDERVVEVYSEPQGRRYTRREVFNEGQYVSLAISVPPDFIHGPFPVSEILP